MSLTIGIDARQLESPSWGVGRVLRCLLREWARDARGHRFVLYFKDRIADLDYLRGNSFVSKRVVAPLGIRSHRFWEQVALPREINRNRVDVFLAPSYIIPFAAPCPKVVVLHDMSFILHPEWYSPRERWELGLLTKWTVDRADRIVCCSRQTREEIRGFYGVKEEDRFVIAPWAADESFSSPAGDDPSVLARLNIRQPYFIFVGYLFQRRNLPILLRSFHQLVSTHPECSLVIVGRDKDYGGSLPLLARELRISERVVFLDYVSEDDLVSLYRSALALVHPSAYEGFGLPVIEAMASGIPVIIGPSAAMAEAAGHAAMKVDPMDEANLTRAMCELIDNDRSREEWIERGRTRLNELSWARTGTVILEALVQAALFPLGSQPPRTQGDSAAIQNIN